MAKGNYYPSRNGHVGKSKIEKDAYVRFINTPQKKIGDTTTGGATSFDASLTDSNKGTPTKYREIKKKDNLTSPKSKKPWKSGETIIFDALNGLLANLIFKVIFGVIVIGVLSVSVITVWNQQKEIGQISAQIVSLNKDVTDLQTKYDKTTDSDIDGVKLGIQIQSDLGYIKDRLNRVESKLGM